VNGRDDAPRPPEQRYPPLTARDKAVLIGVFVLAFGALAALVAWWDRLPFVGRPG
jgi:hypothetical protein